MEEENKIIEEAVAELKGADEETLKKTVERWFERTRTDGLKIGAYFISAAVAGTIEKHLKKGKNVSRRDLERCIDEIIKIVSVQLKQNETQQNDLEENNDDGTAE